MKMKPISLNSRIGSRIFISQGAEESKRFPFALKIAEFGNKIIIYTLFDFPRRGSNLTDSDRIPRGKREWRGCSFHANQIIFRFLHSLHTPESKSTLQARNIFLRLDWKNAKSTQAWTGQEAVRWGWPGGGSRAVRDVLCGKDTMTLTVRNLVARAPLRVVGISLLGSTRWNERPSPFKIFLQFSSTNYLRLIDSSHTGQRFLEEKLSSRCHKINTRNWNIRAESSLKPLTKLSNVRPVSMTRENI